MRLRILAATAVASLIALSGCGGNVPGVSVGDANSSQPAAVTIDSAAALKAALQAAGIQDVHPVNATDGTIAAWAAVPKFKKCPVLFTASGNQYKATRLHKPDKSLEQLEGLPAQPTALDFAAWALTHADLMNQCAGDSPPAEADWPTTV